MLYTFGKLFQNSLDLVPTNISIYTVQASHRHTEGFDTRTLTCNNGSVVRAIVNVLNGDVKTPTHIKCDDTIWSVAICNKYPVICTNCSNPCQGSASMIMNPCSRSNYSTKSTIRILNVDYSSPEPAPSFNVTSQSSSKTNVTISLKLSDAGKVSCGIFDLLDTVSISLINRQGKQLIMQSKDQVQLLLFTGLQPATGYEIFCFTTSKDKMVMELATVKQNKISMNTTCCKVASLTSLVSSVSSKDSSGVYNALSFTLNSRPLESVIFTFFAVINSTLSTGKSTQLTPGTVTYSASSDTSVIYISVSSVVMEAALNASSIEFNVLISGPSASQYEIQYPRGNVVKYIQANSEPPAPYIVSVSFSSSGQSLIVTFNSDTDMGQVSEPQFICSLLFKFKKASQSVCQWRDSSTVIAYSPNSVQIGDEFQVLSSSIKARCSTLGQNCSSWNYTTSSNVSISAPISIDTPIVVIAAPLTISKCDSLSIDISSSTGSGGRAWASYEFKVFDNKNSSDRSDIDGTVSKMVMLYLQTSFSISPPMALPQGILEISTYTIAVKLINFLGAEGQNSVTVSVISKSVPVVQIYGTATREMFRRQSLMLLSDSFVTQCIIGGGSFRTSNHLEYKWSVQKDGSDTIEKIFSSARSASAFKLKPFSLVAGTTYTISLSVMYSKDFMSSSASVSVYVVASDIVAVIFGGGSKSMIPGQNITLDASKSYDLDLDYNELPVLQYSWSCFTVKPRLSQDCDLQYLSSRFNDKVVIKAGQNIAINSVYQVTVQVKDALRSSTAVSMINIIEGGSPTLTIMNQVSKVNPSDKLMISASIEAPNDFISAEARWIATLNGQEVDFQENALTPVSFQVVRSTTLVYLVLASDTLSQRAVYTFQLVCLKSRASLQVLTNGPPLPGVFEIKPMDGTELDTQFTMYASLWIDDDLPLLYSFGYYASNASQEFSTISKRSESSYTKSNLPAGDVSMNYSMRCIVVVFDSLNAPGSLVHSIRVKKFVAVDTAALLLAIQRNLNSALNSSSADDTLKVLSVTSAVLNYVNCSTVPASVCRKMNRNPCSTISQTCGECMDEYIGDFGNSNTMCEKFEILNIAASNVAEGASKPVQTCTVNSDCKTWQFCNVTAAVSRCDYQDKACKSSCSNQGRCLYTTVSTGQYTSNCKMGDASCEPLCKCNQGWDGDDCSVSVAEMNKRKLLRESMLGTLGSVVDNIDSTGITSTLSNIKSLCQNPAELSVAASSIAMNATSKMLSFANINNVPYEDLMPSVDTIDSIGISMVRLLSSSSRRKLISETTGAILFDSIGSLATVTMNQIYVGQDAVTVTKSTIRLASVVLTTSNNFTLSTPSTLLEKASNLNPSVIKVAYADSPQPLKLAAATVNSNQFGSKAAVYLSNPMMVFVDDLTLCKHTNNTVTACTFKFILQNNVKQVYQQKAPALKNYTTICRSGDAPRSMVYSCPNSLNVTAFCDGKSSVKIISFCPYILTAPECFADSSSTSCKVISFSESYTSCECSIPLVKAGSRRLSTGKFSTDFLVTSETSSTTIKPNSVTTTDQAVPSVQPTILVQPTASTESVSKTTSSIGVVVGSIIAAVVVGLLLYVYIHIQRKKLKEKVYIVTDEERKIDDTDAAAPASIYQNSDINNYKIDILESSVIDTKSQSNTNLVLENFDADSAVKSISVTSTNFNDQLDSPAELANKIKGSNKSKKDRAQRKKQRSQKHIEKYTKRFGELASSNTDDASYADNSIYYQADDNSSVQTGGSILTAYKNISTKSSRTRTDLATLEQYDIESAPKYSDLIDDVSILSASSILNIPVDSVQNSSLFDVYSKKYDDTTTIDSNVSLPSIYKSKISSVKSKISGVAASTESTGNLLHNYKQFTESSKKARSKK